MRDARWRWGLVLLVVVGGGGCTGRALTLDGSSVDLDAGLDATAGGGLDAGLVDSAMASNPDLATRDARDAATPRDAAKSPDAALPALAWRASMSGTNAILQNVWGSSSDDLWVVGYAFLHGTGNPITWSTVNVPGQGFALWGASADDFWIVGRYTGHENLAGVAFEGTGDPTTFTNTPRMNDWGIYGMWPQSAQSIWGVGDAGTVVHGQGAPMSWSTLTSDENLSLSILPKAFADCRQLFAIWGAGNEVWAVGSNETIFHGGADPTAWTIEHAGSGVGGECDSGDINLYYFDDLRGVWGSSASDIWAVGHDGLILHGTGSPTTWTDVASGTVEDLTSIWGSSSTDIWVVGTSGTILHGTGDPITWSSRPSGTTNGLYGVWGLSSTDVWAVGDAGTILHYSR